MWPIRPNTVELHKNTGFFASGHAHPKYGVLLLRCGHVASCMVPGDLKELVVLAEPLQAGVVPTVHLGQQPRLQPDPPRLDTHPGSSRGDGLWFGCLDYSDQCQISLQISSPRTSWVSGERINKSERREISRLQSKTS